MSDINIAKSFASVKKLFQSKNNQSVGVDIGTKSIKIVQLERKQNNIALKNYVQIKSSEELIKPGTPGIIAENAGKIVSEALQKADIRTNKINMAVPGFTSLITTIELPLMPENEIDNTITVEASKSIPIPIADVVYGWQVINSGVANAAFAENKVSDEKSSPEDKDDERMKVLLVAIMKEVSKKYEETFAKNKLHIESIEIDAFSLKRSLVGNDRGVYMILDMGEKICSINIVSEGSLIMSRNIDVSGSRFTQIIAKGMNVSLEKAEQLKTEHGLSIDEKFKIKLLEPTIKVVLEEIRKAMEIFKKEYPLLNLENIIICGGTSQMKGLREYLEKELNIKTVFGNPWSKIIYPEQLKDTITNYGPMFSVAVGLALAGFEEN